VDEVDFFLDLLLLAGFAAAASVVFSLRAEMKQEDKKNI
jgi:hypothetical protein